MPIAPLLQRFVDDELDRSADLIARTCAATLEQLRQPRDHLLTASERQHYFELVQAVQQRQADYQRHFVEALRALVAAELASTPAAPQPLQGAPNLAEMQLMDETRVESEIEISRAIQQIDTAAEWELRELQTFTSTLRGQTHVTAESNPLRAASYARALWQAAGALGLPAAQQAVLLRVSATVMAAFLRKTFAAACTRLESQGVEPGIYRTVVIAPGSSREEPPEMDVTRPGALDGLLRSMPAGAGAALPSSSNAPVPRRALPTATPALEQALLRIEDLLRRMPVAAAEHARADAPQLTEHRAALMATTSEMVDRQIIELLSRLFDTLLSDHTLPPRLHAVLARLQVSALRIALLDPSMLDAYDHPVWVLMDRIVTAATTYPQASDPRLLVLLAFCETLVSEMAAQRQQDRALYQQSLARLDSFLADQLRQLQDSARPAIESLQRVEQAEQLQQKLAGRLGEQMAAVPAGALLRRFITSTWARVLTESVMRFGDQSEQTTAYLKVVDDLLWSLKLPDHPQSRQRLVAVLPGLLQRLREGMALVDLPQAERQEVLDELMKVHSLALRPGARPGPPATPQQEQDLSPEEIVRRMREEASPEPAPLDGSAFSDSLIDLASMETVPAALMNADADADATTGKAGPWVQGMAIGQRYRMFLQGTWVRTQLIWRSGSGRYALFAGETAQRTHSVSVRALERLREAQLLGPLHAHTLIQRAVDGMLRTLANPG